MIKVAPFTATVGAALVAVFVVRVYVGEISVPAEFSPTNLKKYLVAADNDVSATFVETTSAPETVGSAGVAVRSAVVKVESVENSTRDVVLKLSGLTAILTSALVLEIASTDLNSTFGAA